MGFVFLDKYDVDACAQQCNTRGADPSGGACQYFNIWRALVNGVPTTYTCSMVSAYNQISKLTLIHLSSTSSPQTHQLPSTPDKEIYKSPIPEVIDAKTWSSTAVSKVTWRAVFSVSLNHTSTGSEQVPLEVPLTPLSSISNLMPIMVMDLVCSVLEGESMTFPAHLHLPNLFKPSLVRNIQFVCSWLVLLVDLAVKPPRLSRFFGMEMLCWLFIPDIPIGNLSRLM